MMTALTGKIRQPNPVTHAMRRTRKGAFLSVTAMMIATMGSAAYGQDRPAEGPAPQPDNSGDIVVTANRRGAESVQNVPTAITAISPLSLAAKGLGSLGDITRSAPAVNFQEAGPGVNRIDMRGITTGSINITNVQDRPLVAVYLDDIPLALQSGNPELKVFDLERIEVLRGPQGTLYGAGSMAGTIRYITVKPDSDRLSGSAEIDGSVTKSGSPSYNVRGLINLPITDTLAIRVGGYQGRNGGFIDNVGTGKKNANYDSSTQMRSVARWKATDRLTIDASFTIATLHTGGFNTVYEQLPQRYAYTTNTAEGYRDNLKIYNLTGSYELGFADFVSSSSYVDRHTHVVQDLGLSGRNFGLPNFANSRFYNDNSLKDFSQEVRLVSAKSDILNWTAGLFYQKTKRGNRQDNPTAGFDAQYGQLIGDPTFNSFTDYDTFSANDPFSGIQTIRERQIALFGEAKLTLGKFDFTAGLRYFDFKQNFSLFFAGVAGSLGPNQPLTQTGTEKAKGVNPRFVAAFKPNRDLMLYAEAAKGFRYGGVNQPVPASFCAADLAADGLTSAPLTFGPDHLWSYTVGEKAELFNRKVTLNVAAFYVDWKQVQTQHNLACYYYFTQNAGRVTSKGLELESRFKLSRQFTISLNAAYTDASAKGAIANAGAADGDRTPYFPKYTVSLSGDYVVPLQDGELAFSADFQARGNSYTEFSPTNPLRREIPTSQVVNASITYTKAPWEIGLFGANLNNSRKISLVNFAQENEIGDRLSYGRPRTIGVRAKVKF